MRIDTPAKNTENPTDMSPPGTAEPQAKKEWGYWWATVIGLVGLICVVVFAWVTIASF